MTTVLLIACAVLGGLLIRAERALKANVETLQYLHSIGAIALLAGKVHCNADAFAKNADELAALRKMRGEP